MKAEELKPCPFCGDNGPHGRMYMTSFHSDGPAKWVRITCRVCGAGAAETIWNNRAGEQQARKEALMEAAMAAESEPNASLGSSRHIAVAIRALIEREGGMRLLGAGGSIWLDL